MPYSFDHQTAVITGAATGIGFEIARQLAMQGASVVLNDIEANRAEEAAERIRAEKGACVAFPGDAAEVDFTYRLVDKAVTTFGQLDLVVANAGITPFRDFFNIQPDDFQRVVNLNLQGTFFLVQAACKHMRERGGGGKVLLMSSNVGITPYPSLTPYCMTKAALRMMARSLVLDLAPHRISINALAPGATVTERTLQDDPDYAQTWPPFIPDGRVAYPDDIARAALFLLSPDAHHITGHTLVVDGGWSGVGQYPHPLETASSSPNPSLP